MASFFRTETFRGVAACSSLALPEGMAGVGFGSYVLHGNTDHPHQLDLYKSERPEYNERPFATLKRGMSGELELQPKGK